MDNKKIFLANLSKGRIGKDASRLLGALLINKEKIIKVSRQRYAKKREVIDIVEYFLKYFLCYTGIAFSLIELAACSQKL